MINIEDIKNTLVIIGGYMMSAITLARVQNVLGILVASLTSVYFIIVIYLKLKKCFKNETKGNKEKD